MRRDPKHLEALERRLQKKPAWQGYILLQGLGLRCLGLLSYLLVFCISLALMLLISLPTLIVLCVRNAFTHKPIFISKEVYGADARKLKLYLFNLQAWLLRQSSLFPYAILGKLNLVGVSFRDYSSVNIAEGDPWLLQFKPGIFSLHFIRSSAKIAAGTQSATDWDYLHHRRGFSDLLLLLLSIPAMLYHQSDAISPEIINIFGINMANLSMAEAISIIDSSLNQAAKTPIFFVNPDCLNKVFRDREYYDILAKAKLIFPDGIGINLAGKMLGTPLRENVNGTDMLPHICELAVTKSYKMFLLGAAPMVADTMRQKLTDKYPGLQICGVRDGFFSWDQDGKQVVDTINASGADILLVALGAPLQEKFIMRFGESIQANIQMGVGGLFDFYSDRIARAPLWLRQIGMEWIFRLLQEPRRMWKRYIIGNPLFLYRVFRWKISKST